MNIFVRQNDNDLLKYLNKEEMEQVKNIQIIENYSDNELLFSKTDKGRDIYLIIEGTLIEWIKKNEEEKIIIDTIYEGEIVGELNFATSIRRHRNLSAKGKTRVIRYPYATLTKLMKNDPVIAAKINAAINDSLADKNICFTQRL